MMLKMFVHSPERPLQTHIADPVDCLLPGYNGRDFKCDFEHEGQCSWTDVSIYAAEYSWERRQRGETLASSGPSSDYTTGTASGTHMHLDAVFCRLRGSIGGVVQASFYLWPKFCKNGYCNDLEKK